MLPKQSTSRDRRRREIGTDTRFCGVLGEAEEPRPRLDQTSSPHPRRRPLTWPARCATSQPTGLDLELLVRRFDDYSDRFEEWQLRGIRLLAVAKANIALRSHPLSDSMPFGARSRRFGTLHLFCLLLKFFCRDTAIISKAALGLGQHYEPGIY
jgi:hypothetical protein